MALDLLRAVAVVGAEPSPLALAAAVTPVEASGDASEGSGQVGVRSRSGEIGLADDLDADSAGSSHERSDTVGGVRLRPSEPGAVGAVRRRRAPVARPGPARRRSRRFPGGGRPAIALRDELGPAFSDKARPVLLLAADVSRDTLRLFSRSDPARVHVCQSQYALAA